MKLLTIEEDQVVDVLDDLNDRAYSIYKEDKSREKEDIVAEAIGDGLIYNADILALADWYGVIDYQELAEKIYDQLFSDMYQKLVENARYDEEEE